MKRTQKQLIRIVIVSLLVSMVTAWFTVRCDDHHAYLRARESEKQKTYKETVELLIDMLTNARMARNKIVQSGKPISEKEFESFCLKEGFKITKDILKEISSKLKNNISSTRFKDIGENELKITLGVLQKRQLLSQKNYNTKEMLNRIQKYSKTTKIGTHTFEDGFGNEEIGEIVHNIKDYAEIIVTVFKGEALKDVYFRTFGYFINRFHEECSNTPIRCEILRIFLTDDNRFKKQITKLRYLITLDPEIIGALEAYSKKHAAVVNTILSCSFSPDSPKSISYFGQTENDIKNLEEQLNNILELLSYK